MTLLLAGFGLGSVLVLNPGGVTSGSIAICASLFIIAGFFYRYFPGAQAANETARAANESLQRLLEATKSEWDAEKDAKAAVSEALDAAVGEAHRLELMVKDREAQIARLEARPDTEQMLRTFEEHHQENLSHMKAMNSTLATVGEGITQLLVRNKPQRSTDG